MRTALRTGRGFRSLALLIAALALSMGACAGAAVRSPGITLPPQGTGAGDLPAATTGAGATGGGAALPTPGEPVSGSAGAANLPDPCALVPRAAAETALGGPVRAGEAAGKAGDPVRRCSYDATEHGSGFLPDGVEISVETTWPSRDAYIAGTQATNDAAQPLPGFGEAGFQQVDERGAANVSFFANGISTYVTIRRAGADAAQLLERAKQVLRQASGTR